MGNLTINAAFKAVYKQELEARGFKKAKGYKMYMKFIDNEVVQFITFLNEQSGIKGLKQFTIIAGMVSIYNTTVVPKELICRSDDLLGFAGRKYTYEEKKKQFFFTYKDDETLMEAMQRTFDKAQELIFPLFEEVTDLNAYISYQKYHRIGLLSCADRLEEDSLALIKADNHDDFMDLFHEYLEQNLEDVKKGLVGGDYEYHYRTLYWGIIECLAKPKQRVYEDEQLYATVMAECAKRKEANLLTLKTYGILP